MGIGSRAERRRRRRQWLARAGVVRPGRGRRWPALAALALAAGIAAGIAAGYAIERALEVERYRPELERQLALLTGLPVAVAELDLAWRPAPCLSAIDVSIGEGDFRATAAQLDVFPALHPLLWRRLEIRRVRADALVLTLPGSLEEAERRWSATREHVEQALAARDAEPRSSRPFFEQVEVGRIVASAAELRLGAEGPTLLRVSATARGVTSDRLELELEAEVPESDARAEGTLSVPREEPIGPGLQGHFELSGVRSDQLLPSLPAPLHATGQARLDVAGEAAGAVALALEGELAPLGEGVLTGAFTGHARLGGEEPAVAELELRSEDLALHASAALDERTARVASLSARGAALAALLALADAGPARVAAAPGAALEARGLTVAFPPGAGARLVAGTIAARGLGVARGGETLIDDLSVDARLADGAIVLEELAGGPLRLSGRIAPDSGWSHVELALSGRLQLADGWLHALGVPEAVRDARGVLAIDELAGSLPPAPDRAPVVVRGRLDGGSLRVVVSEAVEDTVSDLALRLTSREGRVAIEGSARSGALGDTSLSAVLESAERRARGQLTFDAAGLAAYVPDPATRARVTPVLASYGRSPIGFALVPSEASPGVFALALERSAAPRIEAALTLHTEGEAGLGDVEVTADVPAEVLRGVLPDDARLSGSARMRLQRTAADGAFSVIGDLADVGIATGAYVEKRPGEALTVRIERGGTGVEWSWIPHHIEFASATGSLVLPLEEGAVVAPEFDVDLGDWSFLLVDGARAAGRVRGALDLGARTARIALSDVALRFSPELEIDAIDGAVEWQGDDWSVRDLRLRAAESDATLTAALRAGVLEGELTGGYLDVDFARTLLAEIEALRPAPDPEPSPPISGGLAVRLERVGFGRGEARNLRAQIDFAEGDASVRELAFETYEGAVSGTAEVDAREGAPSQLTLDLAIANVTGRFLDDLLAEEPRDVRGRFTGRLRFAAPLHDDPKAMMAEADGHLTAEGKDGSFGRLGLATQLVTVLRSTETLRMRLPTLRDSGLVFDTTSAELALESGVLTVSRFDLESTSYAISATGELDFRRERSRVPIEVNAIRGLTGIVERIPVAGDVLEIVNVRLVATGSPYDLKLGVASIQDQILGAGMVGPNAVIKGIGDALRLLRHASGQGEPPADGGPTTPEATAPSAEAAAPSETEAPETDAPEPPAPAPSAEPHGGAEQEAPPEVDPAPAE